MTTVDIDLQLPKKQKSYLLSKTLMSSIANPKKERLKDVRYQEFRRITLGSEVIKLPRVILFCGCIYKPKCCVV